MRKGNKMVDLLTGALAQSDQLNVYVDKATDELENLTAQERAILLRQISKHKPTDASEAGALAILKYIASEKTR